MAQALDESTISRASQSSVKKGGMDKKKVSHIKGVVNSIFKKNGVEPVKNLSNDFADGILFLKLFNILFDETVELRLSSDQSLEARINNWNKINCVICFNYFQQQFILIGSTMKALAQGKKSAAAKAILCLLECTLGTQFESFLDTSTLKDIASVVSFEVQFDQQDKIDLQTDEKLNQFGAEEEQKAAKVQHQKQPSQGILKNKGYDEGASNEMDFSFQRPRKQKKVCIVEEDIKMTKDEIEIYNQMRDEAEQEMAEQERLHTELFQQQQEAQPDFGQPQQPAKKQNQQPAAQASRQRAGKRAAR